MLQVTAIDPKKRTTEQRPSGSSSRDRPVWKTVIRVTLIIVAIAAIIIAGKYFLPKLITFVKTVSSAAGGVVSSAGAAAASVGGAVSSVFDLAGSIADSAKKTFDVTSFVLTKPLAVEGVKYVIDKVNDGISITTESGTKLTNVGLFQKLAHPFQTIINFFKGGN